MSRTPLLFDKPDRSDMRGAGTRLLFNTRIEGEIISSASLFVKVTDATHDQLTIIVLQLDKLW
ncbi:hypothetical protein D3C75_1375610 [compost metagenome]